MKWRETLAAGTLMIGGGGIAVGLKPESNNSHQAKITTVEHDWQHAMHDSLNDFRDGVLRFHKVSEILLGSCVAWGNSSGGITVTLNPGVVEINVNGKKEDFFVFSTHDPAYKPDWGPLNGPQIGDPNTVNLIFMPRILPKGSLDYRRVSATEQNDFAGHRFYKDIQTQEPVMDTALVDGPLAKDRVMQVCDELRKFEPTTNQA